MKVKLQKIGNSHMVTVPANFMYKTGLKIGQDLEVYQVREGVEFQPVHKKKNFADLKGGTLSVPDIKVKDFAKLKEEAHYDR